MVRPFPRIHRWIATVFYRSDAGEQRVEHDLAELSELHDLIERGPHWDTMIEISIVRAELVSGPITIEKARTL